jgi:hypothetical protein
MTNKKRPPGRGPIPDYRWVADQCRQAARKVSTKTEQADLLARAKLWDFLADRRPHHAGVNEG